MKPRYYQVEAHDAFFNFVKATWGQDKHPVLALPTGTGKSVIPAMITRSIFHMSPNQRVINLVDVKELVGQNSNAMRSVWPQAPIGIYSAGLKQKVAYQPITFAGIQSAAKDAERFGHQDVAFIDECQMISPNENATYKKFLFKLKEINPNLIFCGLSATPYRLGLGMITDGGILTDVAYDVTGLHAFNRLLDEGYLSPLIPMPTDNELDVSGVHMRGGEFVENELQAAVVKEDLTWKALQETASKAYRRNHWLIFATGIDHVRMIVKMLKHMGIPAAGVHSKMDPAIDGERDQNIADFKSGKIRALVNADVLTKGFDFPALDCIVLLRPTSSVVLHVQILGRGTRPFYFNPGDAFDLETVEGRFAAIAAGPKQNCLVLDFAGNTQRLGPINDPRIPGKKGKGTGEIPIKCCTECGCMAHISARVCINCGTEFTFEQKITPQASTAVLIAAPPQPQVEVFNVDNVTYAPHVRPGKTPSLKVSYFCGARRFTEYVCLQHEGGIRHKAHKWWRERHHSEPPTLIDEVIPLIGELKVPNQIRVWVNTKYPEILMHLFEKEPENV
ncbi:ATP-dependent RNA-DNA and DNA-DNA helicase protein [Rhizobium phage RHph_Y55]|nr:ATP-dependent RNA-DNA and DNA-DNA helicase protein [Rhizobium phage RHph_Y55]